MNNPFNIQMGGASPRDIQMGRLSPRDATATLHVRFTDALAPLVANQPDEAIAAGLAAAVYQVLQTLSGTPAERAYLLDLFYGHWHHHWETIAQADNSPTPRRRRPRQIIPPEC